MTDKLTLRLSAADQAALGLAAERIAGPARAQFVRPMTCIRLALAAFNERQASAAADIPADAAA